MTWSVTIDRDRCIGSGMCVVYAPGTFTQDDQAKVLPLDPGDDPLEVVRTAVEACPTHALAVTEGEG